MITTFERPKLTKSSDLGIALWDNTTPIQLNYKASEEEVRTVIRAIYRQVFGNIHIMESERLPELESRSNIDFDISKPKVTKKKAEPLEKALTERKKPLEKPLTVREIVRRMAKSGLYRSRFFESQPRYKFIELNFAHLLGRAPESHKEITEHYRILEREGYEGYEAEIDSYIDSEEYLLTFGEYIVPYYRGYITQNFKKIAGFTHSLQLKPFGASGSDKDLIFNHRPKERPDPIHQILQNKPSEFVPLFPFNKNVPEPEAVSPEEEVPEPELVPPEEEVPKPEVESPEGKVPKPELVPLTKAETRPFPRLYIQAYMDQQVIINRVTKIEVILSRKLHDWLESDTAKTGAVEIEEQKQLLIQVIPKTNFVVIKEDRKKVEPPVPGESRQFYFEIEATQLGKGEVWVVVRQGQILLTTLKLRPEIFERREDVIALQTNGQATKITSETTSIAKIPVLAESLHQLNIIEQCEGGKIYYQYELSSPSLNLIKRYQSEPINRNRNEYIKHLYEEIGGRWGSSQDDIKAFAEELRAFGGELFDRLFPPKLQETLWEHRKELNSIMVISTEPFIPWELVHLKPAGQKHLPPETTFLGQMGLIRWSYDAGWPPTQIKIRQHRVYYVIPHYPVDKYKLPEAEQESQFLEERFKATPVTPQPNPVRELISKPDAFDLLHFACHGFTEGGRDYSC